MSDSEQEQSGIPSKATPKIKINDDHGETSGKGHRDRKTRAVEEKEIKQVPKWTGSPQVWFFQLELQFSTHKITNKKDQFRVAASHLPSSVLESILEEVNLLGESYADFKALVVSKYSVSEEQRIQSIFKNSNADFKGMRPSKIFSRIKSLSENLFSDTTLQKYWLSLLPDLIKIPLIPQQNLTKAELIKMADRMFDLMSVPCANVEAVRGDSQSDVSTRLCRLERMFEDFLRSNSDRSKSKSRSKLNSSCSYKLC